jgi:hypothetical protein
MDCPISRDGQLSRYFPTRGYLPFPPDIGKYSYKYFFNKEVKYVPLCRREERRKGIGARAINKKLHRDIFSTSSPQKPIVCPAAPEAPKHRSIKAPKHRIQP